VGGGGIFYWTKLVFTTFESVYSQVESIDHLRALVNTIMNL
jgi:hypothetical protein